MHPNRMHVHSDNTANHCKTCLSLSLRIPAPGSWSVRDEEKALGTRNASLSEVFRLPLAAPVFIG